MKVTVRAMWNRQDLDEHIDWAYGALKGRPREEAILVQQITATRLAAKGYMSALASYDMSNAFPGVLVM